MKYQKKRRKEKRRVVKKEANHIQRAATRHEAKRKGNDTVSLNDFYFNIVAGYFIKIY